VQDGALVDLRVIAGIEQEISVEIVDRYQAEIERRFREQDPLLRSMLIHSGASAPAELARAAMRRGVVLKSFGEYQRLFDFGPYLDNQTRRLEADEVYPPWLYVEQPTDVSLAGQKPQRHSLRLIGKAPGSTSGVDLDAFGFGSASRFSYVRLTDDPIQGGQTGPTVGADIDAIGVAFSVAVPEPQTYAMIGAGFLMLMGIARRPFV